MKLAYDQEHAQLENAERWATEDILNRCGVRHKREYRHRTTGKGAQELAGTLLFTAKWKHNRDIPITHYQGSGNMTQDDYYDRWGLLGVFADARLLAVQQYRRRKKVLFGEDVATWPGFARRYQDLWKESPIGSGLSAVLYWRLPEIELCLKDVRSSNGSGRALLADDPVIKLHTKKSMRPLPPQGGMEWDSYTWALRVMFRDVHRTVTDTAVPLTDGYGYGWTVSVP
ncbi:uncharacterized protein EV420DRAFT_1693735 [Desarmillaria tabescens]|uniref:Uncharacterized protein n=1 Tax=Armillaria tabescens TaxID=1929756 RepID=A0AA39J052_ARMTA|nr:uncharacterized protein EV420DRAFT_1693735 [Desarmillaria tabescens]KAK0433064.1 hypothetical protein EV420DRAFT_1693735 [Desarmillaria tabescens]